MLFSRLTGFFSKLPILFLAMVLFGLQLNAGAQSKGGIEWLSFDELSQKQKEKPKLVMIDVYANWCGWCKKMDMLTFKNSEVAQFANDNFYALKLNSESKNEVIFQGHPISEAELAALLRVNSLPTIIFLDQKMQEVIPAAGYREPADFLNVLRAVKEHGFKKTKP